MASLKVAVTGSVSAGLVGFIILLGHRILDLGLDGIALSFLGGIASLTLIYDAFIAAISGALFALTYRYAIRMDKNPQLNGGVVLAFTLVRGLAQVDAGSAIAQNFWPFLSACGESFGIFGLTALVLNFAIARGWLTAFGE
ncbi:hypothetical protein [Picosynechococcus sp. NKBG15041c]|uniref:hypothetical protein n=1 Tax=Picosynechococcus sp. NKBG15041c TaxID=1407650 RepID=UPI0004205513|nr:hypothetical protein [Picosynechococcus sp. NKBG15041c]